MKETEYTIDLKVTLQHITPPDNRLEKMEREAMQAHIDGLAGTWLADKKNQQNLMNMILKNNGILI